MVKMAKYNDKVFRNLWDGSWHVYANAPREFHELQDDLREHMLNSTPTYYPPYIYSFVTYRRVKRYANIRIEIQFNSNDGLVYADVSIDRGKTNVCKNPNLFFGFALKTILSYMDVFQRHGLISEGTYAD